jgi:dipeptidyl-peptidase-4
MDRYTGYWWAPRDRYIAAPRVDDGPVKIVTRAAIGSTGTHTFNQRYPAAGTANANVALYILTPDGRQKIAVDLGRPPIDTWRASTGRPMARSCTCSASPAIRNAWICCKSILSRVTRKFFSRKAPAPGSICRTTSGSSRTAASCGGPSATATDISIFGARVLDAADPRPWEVDKVVGVDEKLGRVYFTGNRETPLEQQVYALDLANPRHLKRLTENGWWNSATMDESAHRMIVTRSNPQQPPQVYLADTTGGGYFGSRRTASELTIPMHPISHITPEPLSARSRPPTALRCTSRS